MNDPTSIIELHRQRADACGRYGAQQRPDRLCQHVADASPSAEWACKGAEALEVSTDGIHWSANLTLAFTSTTPTQTVFVRAVAGDNTYPLNETIIVASTIIAVGGDQRSGVRRSLLPTIKVTLGDERDRPDHRSGPGKTTNTNGQNVTTYAPQATTIVAGQTTYTYNLSLNQQPAPE